MINFCATHCALTGCCFINSATLPNLKAAPPNKEIEQYLKKRVAEFEKEHGPIEVEPKES